MGLIRHARFAAGVATGAGVLVLASLVSAWRAGRAFDAAMAPARAMAEQLRDDVAASRLVLDRAGAAFNHWTPERRALELELARVEIGVDPALRSFLLQQRRPVWPD